MGIRDAAVSDIDEIANILDTSRRAVERMLHERTVRVAVDEGSGSIRGIVGFDASPEAVQVTRLAGDHDTYEVLLEEPIRYASGESLPVEMVVPADEDEVRAQLEAKGFESLEAGPTFEHGDTIRYRRDATGQ